MRAVSSEEDECGPRPQRRRRREKQKKKRRRRRRKEEKSDVDLPPQFTVSRWAAEMSSRTDGPEQITNNMPHSETAETHGWRRLILQTEI